jgi:hypothetical protein
MAGLVQRVSGSMETVVILSHVRNHLVMAVLVTAIHVFLSPKANRGWPEQVRP